MNRRRMCKRSLCAAAVLGITGTAGAQVVGFGGSSETGWTPQANAASSAAGVPNVAGTGTMGDVLNLTTPAGGEASGYWFNTPQNITNFAESFTYTAPTPNGADGVVAAWQNTGTSALGAGGGSMGFGGIPLSAGLAMNIYGGNSGSGSGFNNATANGGVALTPTPGGVNLNSGDPINVSLNYNGSAGALTESMTDATTSATFTRVWRGVNIQSQVGGTTAFVGFTGGTGGVSAAQSISNFQFTPGGAAATPVAMITPIAATGYNQNMIISTASGSANITATMDGGTGKAGDTFYEKGVNPGSNVAGVPQPGVVFGSGNDAIHTFSLQPNGAGQNDALMLDSSQTSGTLSLSNAARYSMLSFLVSGANGGGNINVTINYANGGTQTATVAAPDWFNNTPIAFAANGRVDVALDDFNNTNNGNPRLYQEDLALTDTTDAVQSIDVSWGGSNREVIYGLSGAAVPEPATLGLLSIGAFGLLARRRRA